MASNSSSMIKQLLKLNWLSQNVVFVSVLHILYYGNNNYVQPLKDMKNYSVFLAQIIFCLHDDLSMLFLLCGEGGAKVKHSHSNTTASISFRVHCIVESILPNLLLLPPRCNPYCLRNSDDPPF